MWLIFDTWWSANCPTGSKLNRNVPENKANSCKKFIKTKILKLKNVIMLRNFDNKMKLMFTLFQIGKIKNSFNFVI